MKFDRKAIAMAVTGAVGLGLSACAPTASTEASSGDTSPVTIGIIGSMTGPYSTYAEQCVEGVKAGIDHATKGSMAINGHPVKIEVEDDAFNVAKIAGGITNLVEKGATILITCNGSDQSLAASEIAAQNQTLLITGFAAGSVFTGKNKYTFRASPQGAQVAAAMAVAAGEVSGEDVGVFSLNSQAGQTFASDAEASFKPKGATVKPVLVPTTATDLTPYAQQTLASSTKTLLVQWYGATTPQMWAALNQQGVLDARTVYTALDSAITFPLLAPAVGKAKVASHYFKGVTDNTATKAFTEYLKANNAKSTDPDIIGVDGWNAGVMAVHAFESSTTAVEDMIGALEGWKFESPMGSSEIRAEDHAMLSPIYLGDLVEENGAPTPKMTSALPPEKVAPPIAPMGGK